MNSFAHRLGVFTRFHSVISRNQRAATAEVVPDLLPRQESFASLHILTRCASEGSEALPSLARWVSMCFFGARVIQSVTVIREPRANP